MENALATLVAPDTVACLDHMGLLAVAGRDALAFLNSQLTTDIATPPAHSAGLTGYCTAKGRLIAIALGWRTGNGANLLVPRDIIATLRERLQKYVLRSKLTLQDVTGAVAIWGLAGIGAKDLLQELGIDGAPGVGVASSNGGVTAVAILPSQNAERWILICDGASISRVSERLMRATNVSASYWRWLDVRGALPWILPGIQEQFVPQMVNLDALGGVDFHKGCFPGQEVVARSHHLSRIKRRMALLHANQTVAAGPGDAVFHSIRPGEAEGMVVNAMPAPTGGIDLLAELPLGALGDGTLHLGAIGGPILTPLALPYALPDNDVFVRPKL